MIQQQSMNNTGMHCKVTYLDEVRRFRFEGTEFSSLRTVVRTIFDMADHDEFVLKYIDEEGDLVTISTDRELLYALGYSQNPNVLKLTVVIEEKHGPMKSDGGAEVIAQGHSGGATAATSVQAHEIPHREGSRRGRGGRGGRGGGRRGRGHPKDEDKIREKRERREKKLATKRIITKEVLLRRKEKVEGLISYLNQQPHTEGNAEFKLRRLEKLKERLATLEARIAVTPDHVAPNDHPQAHPVHHEGDQSRGDGRRKPRKRLSPEESQRIVAIKDIINNNKELIHGTKGPIGAKKAEIAECEDERVKGVLVGELKLMKQQVFDLRKTIRSLKEEIQKIVGQ